MKKRSSKERTSAQGAHTSGPSRREIIRGGMLAGALLAGQPLYARFGARTLADDDCGVASGDPRPDGVVLWTRVPSIFQPDDGSSIQVSWQVATSSDFGAGSIVQSGSVSTAGDRDYTVKVKVSGLSAGRTYYYRFSTTSGYSSVVGRTRTAPASDASPSAIRFAFISCESFTSGYYNALHALAQDDVDFCVMLGDAVYEGNGVGVRADTTGGGSGRAETLDQWRNKWKLYLSDPNLREVRRLFPWIYIWDDHEVMNNFAGGDPTVSSNDRSVQRNAYQVYREFTPIDPVLPSGESGGIAYSQIYRSFAFGSLLEVFALDGRQYRDGWICGRDYATVGCDEIYAEDRTNLGAPQLDWLLDGLGASSRRWKVLLNQTMMMGLKLSNGVLSLFDRLGLGLFETYDGYFLNGAQWDGYPAERDRLLSFVRDQKVSNFMVVTGDIHNCYAGLLKPDFSSRQSQSVGVEIVGGSVSSPGIGEYTGPWNASKFLLNALTPANPHLLYVDAKFHVYTRVEVTPEATYSTYVGVSTVLNQSYEQVPLQRFTIPDGVPTLLFG